MLSSLDHNYLQRLVESSPDIVIAVNRDGTIIFYNDGARGNCATPGQIIGQKITVSTRRRKRRAA